MEYKKSIDNGILLRNLGISATPTSLLKDFANKNAFVLYTVALPMINGSGQPSVH